MTTELIEQWVNTIVKNENLTNYTYHLDGTTAKNDGYLGNIFFITVNGKTKNGKDATLNLAVKSSKESAAMRATSPIQQAFHREIYIYNDVYNEFNKLQGNKNFLDLLPRSFGYYISDSREFLILENLRTSGYQLWDRRKPMTYEHVKLVYQAYGKWHAFSFALRNKKKEIFEKLLNGYTNMFMDFFTKSGLTKVVVKLFEQSRDACITDKELLKKLQYSSTNAKKVYHDLFYEDPDERVILHGDCWNNNFMFNYENGDETKPSSVKVLDWQFSGYSSPAMDLSHFLYGSCDTGLHQDITDLLKTYYASFSTCLRHLDCNPDEIFPYERLLYHWKKYSAYGLLLNAFLVKFTIIEGVEVPDPAEAAEQGKSYSDSMDFDDFPQKDEYHRRVRNNLIHYVYNSK